MLAGAAALFLLRGAGSNIANVPAGTLNLGQPGAPNIVADPNFMHLGAASGWGRCPDSEYFSDADVTHPPASTGVRHTNGNANLQTECTQTVTGAVAGRSYNASVWVKSQNISGPTAGATFCVEWSDKHGKFLGGAYAAGVSGATDWTLLSTTAHVPSTAGSVRFSLFTRHGSVGTAWYDSASMQVTGSWMAMTTVLLSPLYRGRITGEPASKGGCAAIRLHAYLSYAAYGRSSHGLVLTATLSPVSDTGAVGVAIETLDITDVKPALNVTFKTAPASLAVGQYIVTCRFRNASSGALLNVSSHNLTRVASSATQPTAWFDEQQRLIHNGKPKFVLGLYMEHANASDLAIIGKSKFNTIMPYWPPNNMTELNDIHKNGLSVMYSTKSTYFGCGGTNPAPHPSNLTCRAKEEAFVKAQMRKYKSHAAVLGWYINDELKPEWIPDLQAHYQWTKAVDPNHPAWSVLFEAPELRLYMRTFDVVNTLTQRIRQIVHTFQPVWN